MSQPENLQGWGLISVGGEHTALAEDPHQEAHNHQPQLQGSDNSLLPP